MKLIFILCLLIQSVLAIPYLDAEGNFYLNYTGRSVLAEPAIGFVCISDSLDLDSLLVLYPVVNVMDSLAYHTFLELYGYSEMEDYEF